MDATTTKPLATVMIGGITYQIQEEGTLEHDMWMMALVREHGLDQLALEDKESSGDFVARTLDRIVMSGVIFRILAGALIPPGKEWSPAVAAETEEVLRKIRTHEDKATMRSLVLSVLIGFFEGGLPLWMSSRKSSGEQGVAQPSANPIPNATPAN